MSESELQRDIRLALGRYPGLVLWRNNTGVSRSETRTIRYGLCVGSADLIGVLAPSGRFVALEVKTATGRVSREQELFLNLVRRNGGIAEVVRTVEEAKNAIDRAISG